MSSVSGSVAVVNLVNMFVCFFFFFDMFDPAEKYLLACYIFTATPLQKNWNILCHMCGRN